MRTIFVYTFDRTQEEWRIFSGLRLRDKGNSAEVLYVDDSGGIRIEELEHITKRCSAHCYVEFEHVDLLIQDIERDWNYRHCFRAAHDDAKALEAQFAFIVSRWMDHAPKTNEKP